MQPTVLDSKVVVLEPQKVHTGWNCEVKLHKRIQYKKIAEKTDICQKDEHYKINNIHLGPSFWDPLLMKIAACKANFDEIAEPVLPVFCVFLNILAQIVTVR